MAGPDGRYSLIITSTIQLRADAGAVGSAAPRVNVDVVSSALAPAPVVFRTGQVSGPLDAIFTVTAGGPGTATEILNLYAYRKSFTELSIGYGSALAVALLVVTILISGVLFALRRAK